MAKQIVKKSRNRAWIAFNIITILMILGGLMAIYGECAKYPDEVVQACVEGKRANLILSPELFFFALIVGNIVFWARSGGRRSGGGNQDRECPHCKQLIPADASVCAVCKRESEPWIAKDGIWWTKDSAGNWQWYDAANQAWRTPAPPE